MALQTQISPIYSAQVSVSNANAMFLAFAEKKSKKVQIVYKRKIDSFYGRKMPTLIVQTSQELKAKGFIQN